MHSKPERAAARRTLRSRGAEQLMPSAGENFNKESFNSPSTLAAARGVLLWPIRRLDQHLSQKKRQVPLSIAPRMPAAGLTLPNSGAIAG